MRDWNIFDKLGAGGADELEPDEISISAIVDNQAGGQRISYSHNFGRRFKSKGYRSVQYLKAEGVFGIRFLESLPDQHDNRFALNINDAFHAKSTLGKAVDEMKAGRYTGRWEDNILVFDAD